MGYTKLNSFIVLTLIENYKKKIPIIADQISPTLITRTTKIKLHNDIESTLLRPNRRTGKE